MENKINIEELLKDCPKGMELDCTMYDSVHLGSIIEGHIYPIEIQTPVGVIFLSKYGCCSLDSHCKCIIFPKGKTTWEGFQRPFKDGDILFVKGAYSWVLIYKESENKEDLYKYVAIHLNHTYIVYGNNPLCYKEDVSEIRFATEEEKQKLFDTIKANGYKWNEKTKTLEKLPKFKVGDKIRHKNDNTIRTISYIYHDSYGLYDCHRILFEEQDEYELDTDAKPRFKVGDRIKAICNNNQYDIKELTDTHYTLEEVDYKFKYTEPISEDKNWELVPNKFDITTLKPFESRVLVRHNRDNKWCGSFFSHIDEDFHSHCYRFVTLAGKSYPMCIPYEGNQHLLGKVDDCDEFYKTW